MDFFPFLRKYRHLPRALRDVASLNLFVGAGAILSDLVQLLNGNPELPIGGMISVMIGLGLLDLNPLARSTQMFLLRASLYVVLPLFVLGSIGMTVAGKDVFRDLLAGNAVAAAAVIIVSIGLSVWELRVLNRPAIRELFGKGQTFATILPSGSVPRVPSLPLPAGPEPSLKRREEERVPRV